MATNLRNSKWLHPVFRFRDRVMTKLHLFEAKKNFKQWAYFKRAKVEDALRRRQIAKQIYELPLDMLTLAEKGPNIIVSITSYGKRVKSSAAYALYSILTQKQLPNRVVLNLDQEKWNNDNLPKLLKYLQKVGVEINFCEDVGPHTKLLPTLSNYPHDIIITVDDDVYYDDTLVCELYNGYIQSDKRSVICREGKYICKHNRTFLPYSLNPHCNEKCNDEIVSIIPFGVGGVLYPPHIFSKEIFNKEVFRKLCRFADDVWFGVMELREKINIVYLANNSFSGDSDVDRNDEYNPKESNSLFRTNDLCGKNDEQYSALLQYYKL